MQQVHKQAMKQPSLCLLVDDHAEARKWMRTAVCHAFSRVRILEADSLHQAQPLLKQQPDLALLDIGLPDGSGIDLVAPLIKIGCEVVIATAFGDDEHLFNALKQGATGYILKGDPHTELIGMLVGILDGHPPLSPRIARRLLSHFSNETHKMELLDQVKLTVRERDVLTLLAKGYTIKDTAGLLDIKYYTVAGYAKSVYRKLNISSRAEATLEAARRGYLGSD